MEDERLQEQGEGQGQEVVINYSFLGDEKVQQHFADVNIELLRGRHIQQEEFYSFQLLSNYEREFGMYYDTLYGMVLNKEIKDNQSYFYLSFPDDAKGKLYHSDRHKELSEIQTIIGIILMNMYYERYFEHQKEIRWEEIKKEITEGEFAEDYQRVFFGEARAAFTDTEWEELKKRFRRTIRDFEKLGWVKLLTTDEHEIHFVLKESIHRFAKLYQTEVENFDQFVQKIAHHE